MLCYTLSLDTISISSRNMALDIYTSVSRIIIYPRICHIILSIL